MNVDPLSRCHPWRCQRSAAGVDRFDLAEDLGLAGPARKSIAGWPSAKGIGHSMLPLLAGAAAAALFSIQGSLLYDADEVMPVGPADAGLPEMKAIDSLTKDMTFCE